MDSDADSYVPVKRRRHEEESDDPSEESEKLSDEEEEDEEEEDDEEVRGRHGKRGKRHRDLSDVRNLFIDEAEAVDEDEEEEEDFDEDAELLGHEDVEAIQSAMASARDLEARNRMQEFTEQDADELERYFTERYEKSNFASRQLGEGYGMAASIQQQQNIPGIKDPHLWLVKCQIGEERATAITLARKFLAFQCTASPLQIKSVIAKDTLKGYIYIEAFKQTHVKQAIEGVSALARAQFDQKLVPVEEMIDVLRVVKETTQLKPKQWVRIKGGRYKNDLARVESVEDAQNIVWLKLVPRIDYDRKRNRIFESEPPNGDPSGNANRKFNWKRPPAALFDPSKVSDRISTNGRYVVFEGNQYDSAGFLLKDFRINTVISEGIRPTLSELELFNQMPDGVELAAAAASVASKGSVAPKLGSNGEVLSVDHGFLPGDIVEVCDGELRNLRGRVTSAEPDGRIIVQPSHNDLKEPIPFNTHELRKYFEQGDHVKVINGRYKNETGLLLVYEPNICLVLPDSGMSEIRVAPRDLRLWQGRAGPTDSGNPGGVQLNDFVQIDTQNAGVVIQMDRENISILTCHGRVVNVRANTALRVIKFGGPRSVAPQALDHNSNIIKVKDTVRFLDKPYTGTVGEIRYIYRSWIFVYCRTYPENSGMMVGKSKQVALIGGSNTNNEANSDTAAGSSGSRPAIQQLAGNRRGGRGGGGIRRGGGNQVDRSLIGKSARIIAGTLKGLTGIICDATAKEVLMELHSQFKKVHVLRMNVGLLDRSGNLINDGRTGAGTPRPTPMREPRTPMAGSATPRLGSMTPRADATPLPYAFNPTVATPAHFGGDDGSSTPGYQPWQTPDVSRTPRSGLTMDDEDDD
ncbi:hypothetical protein ACTXT7_010041 [Hymenolepis weldensis]